jgi:hypothetical protein
MTPQERELLQDFLRQLTEIRGVDQDAEAQAMIARAVAQQPDAAYLLVQRAMLLEQALNAAKAQIAELQAAQGGSGRGFLSGANSWGRAPAQAAPRSSLSVDGRPIPADPAGTPLQSAPVTPIRSSPFGGFLGQAAATAAGVAGGAFLFQGLGNLLGHHDAPGQHLADQQPLHDAANDQGVPASDDDYEDITADADLDDFDGGGDDDSIV